MTKAELRSAMRQRLRTLGAERDERSRAIAAAVAAHPAFQRSERVALFSPLPSEPDVEWLWEMGARGFCYPRVVGEEMEFVDAHMLADLVTSPWHPAIREPTGTHGRVIAPSEIDLILVPGLAFTRRGVRLGRGGGFYDRFLAQLPARAVKLGVCFELQIVEAIPAEPHDQTMDFVITENGVSASSD